MRNVATGIVLFLLLCSYLCFFVCLFFSLPTSGEIKMYILDCGLWCVVGVVIDRELSCRWQPMSRPSVAPVTISFASFDQYSSPFVVRECHQWRSARRSPRVVYCNSLLYGISDGVLRRLLQSVQNVAARLVTGARRSDHITPVLRQLHWLPVRQRVVF